ncbi:ATP-dependent RecD-like DNA helicase, partial [Coprococcus sp. MSK.21.13]|nr:ATP-dependent RecD-like DNA helicase [Coprococcus sp. MSK.21.13]
QKVLNPPSKEKKEKKFKDCIFRVGDKIMQTKNNYNIKWRKIDKYDPEEGMGIFNGDIGYIEDIDEENNNMTIIFDEEKKVIYEDIYLDEIDLAYAITIHKS